MDQNLTQMKESQQEKTLLETTSTVWKGECSGKEKTHLTASFGPWAIPSLENWALQQLPLEKCQVIQNAHSYYGVGSDSSLE